MTNPESEGSTEDLFEEFFRRERDGGERDRQRTRVVSEFVRRTIENAVGQVQQSSTVPREALSFLLHQGDKGKRELVRIVATEVGDFLRHVDISTEVVKVLSNIQMDFQASVRFKRTGDGLEPDIQTESSVTPVEPPPDEAADDDEDDL